MSKITVARFLGFGALVAAIAAMAVSIRLLLDPVNDPVASGGLISVLMVLNVLLLAESAVRLRKSKQTDER